MYVKAYYRISFSQSLIVTIGNATTGHPAIFEDRFLLCTQEEEGHPSSAPCAVRT